VPSNWSTGQLPGPRDDVVIDMPGVVTVTHAAGADAVRSLVCEESFILSGGSLSLATASVLNGPFTQSGGGLTGGGDVTVNGPFNWTNGAMTGAGVTRLNGVTSLSSGGVFARPTLDNRVLDNAGSATWAGGDALALLNNATWNNLAGAVFGAFGDAGIVGDFFEPTARFNNAGTFLRAVTAGTFDVGVPLNNSGTVAVLTGTLNLGGGGNGTGLFAVAGGAALGFTGGTHALHPGSAVVGDGNVTSGGFTYFAGYYAVGGTTAVTGNAARFYGDVAFNALTVSAGVLTVTGNASVAGLLTWTGGTMNGYGVTRANGGIEISSSSGFNAPTLDGRILENAGTAVWTGTGPISAINDGTWINLAGATIEARSDAPFSSSFFEPTARFYNYGTFRKTLGSGTTAVSVFFYNFGAVEVLSGALSVGGGSDGGAYFVAAGATLGITSGTRSLSPTTSVTGGGSLHFGGGNVFVNTTLDVLGAITIAGGNVNLNRDVTLPALTLSGGVLLGTGNVTVLGPLTWTGGTMSDSSRTLALGNVEVSGPAAKGLDNLRTFENAGTLTMTGTGPLNLLHGAVFHNLGPAVVDIQSDVGFGSGPFGPTASVVNVGWFRKSGGAGTSVISPFFINYNLLEVASGTMSFASFRQVAGGVQLNGGTMTSAALIDIQAGYLLGSGVINGNVRNAGELYAGGWLTAGRLTINGNYTQTTTAVLFIELAGPEAGTQFDQLQVTGTATLDGTLSVSLLGGYFPAPGDAFAVLTFAGRVGDFAAYTGLDLGGVFLNPVYDATSLTLVATA
jgi:hypothetical protein